ncbi:hypothetical protein E2C01_045296 [Portunus trituberculatus]|uniref:Uncharacterized protein n=1 Tax=Portunus trituberculatus TaxID=210409 RepID=A0A5B7FUL0_PORTR|nr:hypothetical protein [Portunus trituberculatus]
MNSLAARLRTDYADCTEMCLPDCNCGGNRVLGRVGEQLLYVGSRGSPRLGGKPLIAAYLAKAVVVSTVHALAKWKVWPRHSRFT